MWQGPRRRAPVPGWPSESVSPNLMDQSSLYRSPRHPSSAVSTSATWSYQKAEELKTLSTLSQDKLASDKFHR